MARESMLPNSFQTPNVVVDRLLWLLSGDELKIVAYVNRRTMGFQRRQDRISLAQFTEGTRSYSGEVLDYGTGLTKDTVRKALRALLKFGVIVETADNDRRNRGKEYALELDMSRIDWDGLKTRRRENGDVQRRRTRAAQEARRRSAAGGGGGLSDNTAPGDVSRTPAVLCDDTPHGPADITAGGLSDSTPLPHGNPGGNPDGNPAGGPCPDDDPDRGLVPLPDGDLEEPARRLLTELGIRGDVADYLVAHPDRLFWTWQWASWAPAWRGRAKSVRGFLMTAVERACQGSDPDRRAPGRWLEMQAEQQREHDRQSAYRKQIAAAHVVRVEPDCEAWWRALLEAQEDALLRGWLEGALSVGAEGEALLIEFEKTMQVSWLSNRLPEVMAAARAKNARFPDVVLKTARSNGNGRG